MRRSSDHDHCPRAFPSPLPLYSDKWAQGGAKSPRANYWRGWARFLGSRACASWTSTTSEICWAAAASGSEWLVASPRSRYVIAGCAARSGFTANDDVIHIRASTPASHRYPRPRLTTPAPSKLTLPTSRRRNTQVTQITPSRRLVVATLKMYLKTILGSDTALVQKGLAAKTARYCRTYP